MQKSVNSRNTRMLGNHASMASGLRGICAPKALVNYGTKIAQRSEPLGAQGAAVTVSRENGQRFWVVGKSCFTCHSHGSCGAKGQTCPDNHRSLIFERCSTASAAARSSSVSVTALRREAGRLGCFESQMRVWPRCRMGRRSTPQHSALELLEKI